MKANYPVYQIKEFTVGDQILYDDSLNYHRKLDTKWVGPWTIVGILYHKTYKVVNYMRIQVQLINSDHLKLY